MRSAGPGRRTAARLRCSGSAGRAGHCARRRVERKEKKKCAAAIQKALADCHAADLDAVEAHAEDYCARLAEADRLRAELERVERTEADLNQQRQTHWTNLRTLVDTFAPEVKDVFGFSAAITRALTLLDSLEKAEERQENAQRLFDAVAAHGKGVAGALAEQPAMPLEQAQAGFQEAERRLNQYHNELSMAMGYSSAKGGAEAIQAELESIDQQLEHYHLDYDALGIALEALEEADAEMRNRFSPGAEPPRRHLPLSAHRRQVCQGAAEPGDGGRCRGAGRRRHPRCDLPEPRHRRSALAGRPAGCVRPGSASG